MPAPVRIALVGNSFAAKVQLPALRWAGGNEVVGIAGTNAPRAEATAADWNIPVATTDWRELLALAPDLAIITTPVDLHAPMVRAFLAETGAAILCEKPFTLNATEAADLAREGAGRLCLLDHQLRWSPWRRRLRALVQDGFLGTPWSGRIQMHFGGPARLNHAFGWWYDAERGGGILGAIASHLVDSLQFDMGAVLAVRARLATYRKTRPDAEGIEREVTADEHATLWLRMANGAEVSVDTNIMAPNSTGSLVEYVGSEGTLRLEEEDRLLGAKHDAKIAPIELDASVPTHTELGMPDQGIFARILPLYLKDVISAVGEGSATLADAATFTDGIATMRVLDAARRSATEGTWVPCQP
ncbi:MAG: Gfo/Idh/MocA family oxidoreductase [Planctomycetota bacterium]|nr:MAG: Gfo/Idh/MocA family oxidoreductase [Planctomycetota bacterium]